MYKNLSKTKLVAALILLVGVGAISAGVLPSVQKASADMQYLPADHLVLKSARDVDLKAGTVVIPIHRGVANGETVWYLITDVSDYGVAHDLNALYAPKLVNMAINRPECVQTVTLGKPTGKFNNNEAIVRFQGAPDFGPTRTYTYRPATSFPPVSGGAGLLSAMRTTRRLCGLRDRTLFTTCRSSHDGRRSVRRDPSHQHGRSRAGDGHRAGDDDGPEATMLLARGFDSGQPIVYLSTEASDPGAASVERATYVPLLAHASFANGDDNLGSARERIFVFVNGVTSPDTGQGLMFLGLNGNLGEDATLANAATLGSPMNVQGDFPSLDDPRHANAYSPLWDVQLGVWTNAAVAAGKNVRQTDENQILNLVGDGDITGPGGAPYGSAFVVNCPPVAFVDQRPSADLAQNVFNR